MIEELQNVIDAKKATHWNMGIRGRLSGGSKMLAVKSLYNYSSYIEEWIGEKGVEAERSFRMPK